MTKRDETTPMDLPPAHREDEAPAAEVEKRSRSLGELRVAIVLKGDAESDETLEPVDGSHEDVRAAEKWIKDEGLDGEEYVVLRLVSRLRVAVETTVRRTVTEVRP